jgi:hypothetical protein
MIPSHTPRRKHVGTFGVCFHPKQIGNPATPVLRVIAR